MELLFDTLATPFWCDFQMRRAIAMDPGGTSKVVALIGLDEFSQGCSGSMPSLQYSDARLLNIFASDDTVLAELKIFANSVEVVGSPPKKRLAWKRKPPFLEYRAFVCTSGAQEIWSPRWLPATLWEACLHRGPMFGICRWMTYLPSGSQWVYTIRCIRKWRPHGGYTTKACHWFARGRMGAKST